MSPAVDPKIVAQRFFEEVCNRRELDTIDAVVSPDVVNHDPIPGEEPGTEGLKKLLGGFFASFPNLSITVDFMIAEDNMVACRVTTRGTHMGEFMGRPGTGRKFSMEGEDTEIFRVVGGRIIERWANFDDLGMLQQLGLVRFTEAK